MTKRKQRSIRYLIPNNKLKRRKKKHQFKLKKNLKEELEEIEVKLIQKKIQLPSLSLLLSRLQSIKITNYKEKRVKQEDQELIGKVDKVLQKSLEGFPRLQLFPQKNNKTKELKKNLEALFLQLLQLFSKAKLNSQSYSQPLKELETKVLKFQLKTQTVLKILLLLVK